MEPSEVGPGLAVINLADSLPVRPERTVEAFAGDRDAVTRATTSVGKL